MIVRPEHPADIASVRAVNVSAFATSVEANLVDLLRARVQPFVSLVADDAGMLVGHILFSPVTLLHSQQSRIIGLAPMAVIPARQRQGVGSALVREGLERCRDLGFEAVVVLGHPNYYPRFGFMPASCFNIRCEYDVADEFFMAMELTRGGLKGKSGTIRYNPVFGDV